MPSAAVRSYGATAATAVAPPQAVTIDDHRRPGDELTSLIAVSDVITGDYYDEDKDGSAPVFRDVPFAILFLIHLAIMLWLGIFVAPAGYEKLDFNFTTIEDEIRKNGDDGISDADIQEMEVFAEKVSDFLPVYPYRIVTFLVLPCLLISFLIAFLLTSAVIKPYTKPFVYSSLVGSMVGTAVITISAAVASRAIPMYLLAGLSLLAVFYYVRLAWSMVPFAAVNLKVALTGISVNWGVYIIAFFLSAFGFLWNIYWVYVLVGLISNTDGQCFEDHPEAGFDDASCSPSPFVMLALLLSLYWTSTIMMNTVQVTVSGVMATWCFVSDEAENCCSPAVFSSLFRSLTYSFGSICLGSLLQAIVSVLRYIIENARNRRESADQDDACRGFCFCILDCLARWLEDLVEYFNQWAYCFVGIYGLSYLESGRKVIELFRARGWTSIVTDNLVGYTMGYAAFAVAIGTGFVGVMVERLIASKHQATDPDNKSYIFGPLPGAPYWAFGVSFLVGFWVASVVCNVGKGAVNALIVCWADSPAKLEYQHPALTSEMASEWRSVFPDANIQVTPSFPARVV